MAMDLGKFGVFRRGSELSPEFADAIERLGYGAIWVGSSPRGDLRLIEELLDATTTITIATGIVNIWRDAADVVAASFHRVEERHPGRFLLGVGVGHPESTTQYAKPYDAVVAYLDDLDAAGVPNDRRVLAALGPRMLELSRERSAGAHPYLVTPVHTRKARAILGDGSLLAPEQRVVLQADPSRARDIGRPTVQRPYLGLSNYTRNLRSLGFDDEDLADGGSDRLIDALVVSGDPSSAAAGLTAHLDAGADHVAINLLGEAGDNPLVGYATLAAALLP
ncbi:MAG TPA: LLM class F420-dependent oxidoreductase [Micromonosporaceae bacterium]|jgi:probable F420-dependent oxidoreductase